MGRFIDYADVVARYVEASKIGGSTEMEQSYIPHAEGYIESRLGVKFTTPFSNNNLTAKDLAIDETFRRMMVTRQPKKADALWNDINRRLTEILKGSAPMITTSGDQMTTDNTIIWSNTKDYHPVFGMGETTDFVVDSSQLQDEEDARL